ncbi:MAG: adenylate/guanylate cyclase domain-containing protein, partial [Anaerolineales bacterium]|nr:adenylate/guanylate cyclase domain-containing protein [Anaerolineales bacterium]
MTDPLLPAVAAFIPRDRVMAIVQETRPFPPTGVALIADISGFTPLTEALTQGLRPDEGAEELTRALGAVFTPLIAEIHAFHGSVIKFGGDALIVWFGRPHRGHRQTTIRRALTAAWRMQQAMAAHGQVPTPIGPVTLRMKIGLAYGRIRRFRLGDAALGYEDALVGDTLDRMAAAEHHAEPGDIVTDAPTLDLLGDDAVVTAWREGFAVVARPRRPARPFPWPPILWPAGPPDALAQRLAPYVPGPVYETLRAGRAQVAELKPVVSLFVQFHGLAYDTDPAVGDKLQRYFVTAQQIVARYGGRLNRLITGDKGSLIHVIFGAPR